MAGPHRAFTDDQVVVELSDTTLESGMAELRWQLHDAVLAGARVLIVDVSRVSHLSSTVVATLLGAHRSCRARGGRVVIRNPNRRTVDLLHRTGLWRVFQVEHSHRLDCGDPPVDGSSGERK